MGTFSVRKTKEQFIADAIAVHGNKYDYSKVDYKGNDVKVCIICPIHGEFWQVPKSHLKGHGCNKCYSCSKHKYGIAIYDIPNSCLTDCYISWRSVLERTIGTAYKKKYTTYKECTICEEWLTFSKFKQWFDDTNNGYQEGYHLDKDLLLKGNKHYSPQTCCFLPPEINTLLVTQCKRRGVLPIGVNKSGNKYSANLMLWNKKKHIGTFYTPEEAFYAYKYVKERYIQEIADNYFKEGKITKKVYNALMKYEVEITD